MKRKLSLAVLLLVLAGIAGYVLSKASLVGRVGISLFYRQYQFLKVWWQAGLAVFAVWMLLFLLQGQVQRRWSVAASGRLQVVCLMAAIMGIIFTYQDFRHTTSHRWLGERFHLGGYIFWLGWMIIGVFYLTQNKNSRLPQTADPRPAISTDNSNPGIQTR